MNRVPMAPHGLILGEDGATASGKLFKCLPGPFPPVWGPGGWKQGREGFRKLPGGRSSVLTEYEPVGSHGDPVHVIFYLNITKL